MKAGRKFQCRLNRHHGISLGTDKLEEIFNEGVAEMPTVCPQPVVAFLHE